MDLESMNRIGEKLATYFVSCKEGGKYAYLMHQLRMLSTPVLLCQTVNNMLYQGQLLGKSIQAVGLSPEDIVSLCQFLKEASRSEVLHFQMHLTTNITECELKQLQQLELQLVRMLEEA